MSKSRSTWNAPLTGGFKLGTLPHCISFPDCLEGHLSPWTHDFFIKHPILQVVAFVKGTRTQPQCGFSYKVLSMLNEIGADYEVLNVLDEIHNPTLREVIKEYSEWPTIPQALSRPHPPTHTIHADTVQSTNFVDINLLHQAQSLLLNVWIKLQTLLWTSV